jgi:hypothetical protein
VIRTFCDCCGEEITEKNDLGPLGTINVSAARAKRQRNVNIHVSASITAQSGRSWSDETDPEHICRHCVIDALAMKDTRPKPAPPLALADATADQLRQQLASLAGPPSFGVAIPRPPVD